MNTYPPDEKHEPSIATGGACTPMTDSVGAGGNGGIELCKLAPTSLHAKDCLETELAKARSLLREWQKFAAELGKELECLSNTDNLLARAAQLRAEAAKAKVELDELKAEIARLHTQRDNLWKPMAHKHDETLVTLRAEIARLREERNRAWGDVERLERNVDAKDNEKPWSKETNETVSALKAELATVRIRFAAFEAGQAGLRAENTELKAELSLTRTNLYAGLDRSVDDISTPHLATVASNALITARAEIVSQAQRHTAPQAASYTAALLKLRKDLLAALVVESELMTAMRQVRPNSENEGDKSS